MVSFDEFYAKAQHVASRLAPNVIPEMFTAPDLLVKEYIRFLYMKYFCNDWSVNGRIQIFTAPEEIQAVWDQHILDTKHYFEDVVALCGRVMHQNLDDGGLESLRPMKALKTPTT
ncbi:hypothetical protein BDZ88DRAFT_453134 [Geranomyces variabilis]|nr:hypothetical protein BDZ88DRAFT_453134 [Geranomyces variabilis]